MRNLLALTFAAMLALTACGTDDGTEDETGTETSAADSDSGADDGGADDGGADDGGADDGGADDGGGDDGASTEGSSDTGSDDGASTGESEQPAGGGDDENAGASGDDEAFCTAMAELDAALDLNPPLLDSNRSPEEVEEIVVDVEMKFQAVLDNSPPEYEADWIIVTDAFSEMTGIIRDADFEVATVDQAAITAAAANEEALAAGDRLPSEQEYCNTGS